MSDGRAVALKHYRDEIDDVPERARGELRTLQRIAGAMRKVDPLEQRMSRRSRGRTLTRRHSRHRSVRALLDWISS
jgi:hypothetical protein